MSKTVKLIIEIPKEVKQAFDKAESNDIKGGYYDCGGIIGKAIQNGIPLPKDHGRLIEASRDLERKLWEYWKETGIDELPIENATRVIDEAPTIIEPDGGGENGNSD